MSLHSISEGIHKFTIAIIVLGALVVFFFFSFQVGTGIWKKLHPPPPNLPTEGYGKIPPIQFPESRVKGHFNYTINTVSGTLPVFPDRMYVYAVKQSPVTLTNTQIARSKSRKLGFKQEGETRYSEKIITPTKYQWDIIVNAMQKTLIMDTDTYNFKFTTSFRTNRSILNTTYVGDEGTAKGIGLQFFNMLGLPIQDIDSSKSKVESLKLSGVNLVQSTDPSTTQLFRVDLFQKDLLMNSTDKVPVYYPYFPSSPTYALVMARVYGTDDVLEATFNHQEADIPTDTSITPETYGIKTSQQAYDELKNGQALITNYGGTTNEIKITDVTLGYYIGEEKQSYVMPIIVFQGDGGFYALVSAVREEALASPTPKSQ